MPQRDAVVRDLDFGLSRVRDELELLAQSYVIVGFPAGGVTKAQSKQNPKTHITRKKKAGLSIPQIAAINEFGTDKIPARPFLYSTVDENRDKINLALAKQYEKILAGTTTVYTGLSIIGTYVKKLVDDKIGTLRFPPNAPSTIAAKGSDKPLIDFGQMRAALQYKVVLI